MLKVFDAVVTPMLETTKLKSSISVGTCFFVETENCQKLSCLLIFVGLGPEESFGFLHFESFL